VCDLKKSGKREPLQKGWIVAPIVNLMILKIYI